MKFKISKEDLASCSDEGYFGEFGGSYISETVRKPLTLLKDAFYKKIVDTAFMSEYQTILNQYSGRPTPITVANNLGPAKNKNTILLKREDLNHTGSHKINNAIGQALLAKQLGKRRLLAESGAGQHGVAVATAGALLNMKTTIYMGAVDIARQSPNVDKIKALGGEVIAVSQGSATLKDALNQAFRDWTARFEDSHYVIGSVNGPHPYPLMVRCFQQIIGFETKQHLKKMNITKPDFIIACVGGGSNAMGIFHSFIKDTSVSLIGVEAGGDKTGNSASIAFGKVGILHGQKSYVLCDKNGMISGTHSISAGMDYPGVGPEHAYYYKKSRIKFVTISDKQALASYHFMAKKTGILPALESSHAIAYAMKLAKRCKNKTIVVNVSGRGDKDLLSVLS